MLCAKYIFQVMIYVNSCQKANTLLFLLQKLKNSTEHEPSYWQLIEFKLKLHLKYKDYLEGFSKKKICQDISLCQNKSRLHSGR